VLVLTFYFESNGQLRKRQPAKKGPKWWGRPQIGQRKSLYKRVAHKLLCRVRDHGWGCSPNDGPRMWQ